MTALWIEILNMSIQSSYLITAVIAVRFCFRRLQGAMILSLWAVVGLRLLLPVELTLPTSLVPGSNVVISGMLSEAALPDTQNAVSAAGSGDTAFLQSGTEAASGMGAWGLSDFLPVIWIAGMMLMLASALISIFRLRSIIADAVPLQKGIYFCDRIRTPFIFGIAAPKIYLPFREISEFSSVLAHEQAHISRYDYLLKPMGFLVLTLHWFNPFAWAAYRLFCTDIETACDEHVIRNMNCSERRTYSAALLSLSCRKQFSAYGPLAFGEISVKNRIRRVLSYTKPAKRDFAVFAVILLILFFCFAGTPKNSAKLWDNDLEQAVSGYLTSDAFRGVPEEQSAALRTEGHCILGTEEKGENTRVYLIESHTDYIIFNDCLIAESSCGAAPCILHFRDGNKYTPVRIEYPLDGALYIESVKKMFPKNLLIRALDPLGICEEMLKRQEQKQCKRFLQHTGNRFPMAKGWEYLSECWTDGLSQTLAEKLSSDPVLRRYPRWIGKELRYTDDGRALIFQVQKKPVEGGGFRLIFSQYYEDNGAAVEIITVSIHGNDYDLSVACGRESHFK